MQYNILNKFSIGKHEQLNAINLASSNEILVLNKVELKDFLKHEAALIINFKCSEYAKMRRNEISCGRNYKAEDY